MKLVVFGMVDRGKASLKYLNKARLNFCHLYMSSGASRV